MKYLVILVLMGTCGAEASQEPEPVPPEVDAYILGEPGDDPGLMVAEDSL